MNEENIIMQLKSGRLSAIDELYNLYSSYALRTAYLITNDKFMAEDIVQETFIQCIKNINSLKDNKLFKPWFYKILTRLSYREMKKAKKLLPVENIFEKADSQSFDTYFKGDSEIYNCIQSLGEKHRTTVILFYYNDMSIREISKIMGCREGTVKSRLSYARKQLREVLKNEL